MASIVFFPSEFSAHSAIRNSDFDYGFSVKQDGNVYNFSGSWYCPISGNANDYIQNLVCVCPQTGNCAVVTASFSFNDDSATITGSMTVGTSSTTLSNCGITNIVTNGGTISMYTSNSVGSDSFIKAPYLLGHISESCF